MSLPFYQLRPISSTHIGPWKPLSCLQFGLKKKIKKQILHISGKSWLTGKDSDAGRDWGQEEKGATEDEMAGWHHWLDGRESERTLGVGDGQGGLACCDSRGCKESDTTEQMNWTELNWCSMCLFLSGLFYSAWCVPDSSMFCKW